MFGVVQGSVYPELRAARRGRRRRWIFPRAIGGVSVGESREQMLEAVECACGSTCRRGSLRYVMGVGTPLDIVDCVARGVDLFDCVLPTRNARHGLLYTWSGIVRLGNARYREDERRWRRAAPARRAGGLAGVPALSLPAEEAAAWRLLSLHNLQFYADLMKRIREAIPAGKLGGLREEVEKATA